MDQGFYWSSWVAIFETLRQNRRFENIFGGVNWIKLGLFLQKMDQIPQKRWSYFSKWFHLITIPFETFPYICLFCTILSLNSRSPRDIDNMFYSQNYVFYNFSCDLLMKNETGRSELMEMPIETWIIQSTHIEPLSGYYKCLKILK